MNRRDIAWGGAMAALAAMATGISSTSALADDTGDVLKANEDFRQAMVDANGARLLELAHDDMSFGHAGGLFQSKVEFVKYVVDKEEIFHNIKLYDHWIHVGNDIAISRDTFEAFIMFQGKDQNFLLKEAKVWKKQDGRWRLLLRQAYKIPT